WSTATHAPGTTLSTERLVERVVPGAWVAVDQQPPSVDVNNPVLRDAAAGVESPFVVGVDVERRIRHFDHQISRCRVAYTPARAAGDHGEVRLGIKILAKHERRLTAEAKPGPKYGSKTFFDQLERDRMRWVHGPFLNDNPIDEHRSAAFESTQV